VPHERSVSEAFFPRFSSLTAGDSIS
jgi:hypothetical protein